MYAIVTKTAGCLGVNVDVLPRETATATRGHTFKLKKRYCRTATTSAQGKHFSATGLWMHGIPYQISWLLHPLSVASNHVLTEYGHSINMRRL